MKGDPSKEQIIKILIDASCVFKKKQDDLTVSQLRVLLGKNKIHVPDGDYQRPFSEVLQQFIEIMIDIKNNRMNQSLSLIDHEKQITYLKGLRKGGLDVEKIDEEIEKYEELYAGGLLYSLVDGQHRANYIIIFFRCIDHYGLWEEYSDVIERLLNITLPTYYVWGGREKDFIDFFRSINTSTKATTDVIVWGINSPFNLHLKDIVGDMPLDYLKKGSPEEIVRADYRVLYSILKVCGAHGRPRLCTSSTNKPALLTWMEESDINPYQYIIDLYDDYRRIFDQLENISGKYVIYNLYFILHELKMRNIVLDDDNIKKIVYISNNEIHNQAAISKKYKGIINQVTKFLERHENNEIVENPFIEVA